MDDIGTMQSWVERATIKNEGKNKFIHSVNWVLYWMKMVVFIVYGLIMLAIKLASNLIGLLILVGAIAGFVILFKNIF